MILNSLNSKICGTTSPWLSFQFFKEYLHITQILLFANKEPGVFLIRPYKIIRLLCKKKNSRLRFRDMQLTIIYSISCIAHQLQVIGIACEILTGTIAGVAKISGEGVRFVIPLPLGTAAVVVVREDLVIVNIASREKRTPTRTAHRCGHVCVSQLGSFVSDSLQGTRHKVQRTYKSQINSPKILEYCRQRNNKKETLVRY